ncbi:MAG: GNAT family N-acetyltransferase, partial [Rhodospirillaceae bacterium]
SSVTVRAGRPSDLDALHDLETTVFTSDRLTRRALNRHLQSHAAKVLVAVGADSCLGYALVLFRKDSMAARLYSLAVDRNARGRGIGGMLLQAGNRAAKRRGRVQMRLEVRADNAAARKLYMDAGFRARLVIGDYYQDGMAAVRFEKAL